MSDALAFDTVLMRDEYSDTFALVEEHRELRQCAHAFCTIVDLESTGPAQVQPQRCNMPIVAFTHSLGNVSPGLVF